MLYDTQGKVDDEGDDGELLKCITQNSCCDELRINR